MRKGCFLTPQRILFGRKEILTDVEEITSGNIIDVLEKTVALFSERQTDIEYLYKYYCGIQPILERIKDVRPEICSNVVENRANEIVAFKTGYLMGEPVQYINHGGEDSVSENIKTLNEFMFGEDKATSDRELADWIYICGVGYRMILPDKKNEMDESPFEIYTLDPRYTYVVKNSGLGNKPVMSVSIINKVDGAKLYSIYTSKEYFEIIDKKIVKQEYHTLGEIPVIEYKFNKPMLGAFEIVLPLLDAINEVASNRVEGVEQFIQALMMFKGVDVDDDTFKEIREKGGVQCPIDGDIKYLVQELNQTQTQTLVDYMYQTVLTICGMPNRNGGSSTSDTGSAVIMRDGWSLAEARAKDDENMFKKSEKEFLKLAVKICNAYRELKLKISQIEIRFTRRNYENITEKANVLVMMLNNPKIHPRLAFEHSGMFADAETAYLDSMAYYEEQLQKQADELAMLEEQEVNNAKEEADNDEEGESDV